MAKKAAARRAREIDAQLSRELRKIAEVLDARRICPDVTPLQAGVVFLQQNDRPGWSYRINDLLFHNIEPPRKCLPKHLLGLACRLTANVRGYYDVAEDEDPLSHVEIEITLEARDSDGRRLISSWHFDRHVAESDDAVQEHPEQPTHPRYHFHFGGNRMTAFAAQNDLTSFPHLLLIDGPRPAHPPLDAILAIDFVLSNFLASHWRSLRELVDYADVVASAQRRLWKPYADALPKHWQAPAAAKSWVPSDCWPNLFRDTDN